MSEGVRLLSVRPVRLWGHGHVVSLPPEVRDVLGARFGDQIVFRKIGRYVFISVVHADERIPVSVEELEVARKVLEG
jgi:hypothetical protein